MVVGPTQQLHHRVEREKRARLEAERLLEAKSLELYQSKKQLEQANEKKDAYLRVLNQFALALTEIETEEELVWYVAREVVGKLGFEDCVFYIFDEARQAIVQRAAIAGKNPDGDSILNPLSIPLGQGITGTVAATHRAELVQDVTKDPRYLNDVTTPGCELCVPVEHDGQLLGVLDSEDHRVGFFTDHHLEILQTVASYAGAKIAERRAHTQVLKRSAQLEEKVMMLTAMKEELETAKEKAEETSALKSRFVATISHEIRTPLAGILGSLDLLKDQSLEEEAAGLVEMAHTSGQSLQTLLNDVIDFARSEAGTLQLEPTTFSVRDLLSSLQGFWQPHFAAHGATMQLDLDFTGDTFWGDPARIRQILNNYISNALKYAGGGDIRLVVLRTKSPDSVFRFELYDNGPGLTDEDQKLLFQEFTRVGIHKREIGEGAGLGLAICKQVAELMDGQVGVESDFGKGSCFWLEVPLKSAGEARQQSPAADRALPGFRGVFGRRPRILVAEDVPTNQTIIRMTLEAFECRVTIVNNGVEAVEAATTHQYDMIFMDIAMPEMDGTAATRRIYQLLGPEKAPPIFALTAHGMDEDREDFERAGMRGIITKPFDRADLYATIELAMRQASEEMSMKESEQDLFSEHPEFDQQMVSELLQSLDEKSRTFLMQQCVADITAGMKHLVEGLKAEDVEKVADAAHRLKSVTGTFGLTRIQHMADSVNVLRKTDKEGEAMQVAHGLAEALPRGISALNQMMRAS